jgi:hypothetical protein
MNVEFVTVCMEPCREKRDRLSLACSNEVFRMQEEVRPVATARKTALSCISGAGACRKGIIPSVLTLLGLGGRAGKGGMWQLHNKIC